MNENTDLPTIAKAGGFEVAPAKSSIDISSRRDYKRLETGDASRQRIGALMSQLPALATASSMGQSYKLVFPNGVQGSLMKLSQGGYSTAIIGDNGKIAGTASLVETNSQALTLGAFSVMAAASSQYFLKEINDNIRMIKLDLDRILEFLYGDKKAELMSEMSFVKYAYQNYSSIMSHESQRLATIISLQAARKVAMKDIEFYTGDLDNLVSRKGSQGLNELVADAFRLKDSLELSVQLCAVGSILEVYYSENYDKNYISYMEKDLTSYFDKLEKHLLGKFAAIGQMIQENDSRKIGKQALEQARKDDVANTIEMLKNGGGDVSAMRSQLHSALSAPTRKQEFYIEPDGTLYLKTA